MKRLFLLFCLLPMLASAEPGMVAVRTVTVSGEGKVKVAPDKADLMVTLQREAKKSGDAKKQVDALVTTLTGIAKEHSIAAKDVRTQSISLQPQYSYPENKKPVFTGYIASASITVTVNDLSTIAPVIEALVQGGIDRVDNVTYGVKDEDGLKEQALVKALATAKKKATMLAQSIGQQVGDPVSISESGTSYNPPVMPMAMAMKSDMRMAEAAPPPPPPGELEISSSVTASFALK